MNTPAQQRALARGQPVHPHPHGLVTPGAIYHHLPTATTFRVLCNCAGATPGHHTQRSIANNPTLYRPPTGDEMRAFLTPAPTAPTAVLTPPQPPATLQPSIPSPHSDGSSHAS